MLLHDSGKGLGGNHVDRSMELAEQAMERIQMPLQERGLVRFLIGRHLDLSAALTGRDLNDPATERFLAQRVETLERLKYLTLLTYADVSAVNPSAMSPWRLEQLWRVYTTAYGALTKELETEPSAIRHAPEHAEFLEGFPVRYLRTHPPEEIEKHIELERQSRTKGSGSASAAQNGSYQVTVVAKIVRFCSHRWRVLWLVSA